MIDYRVQNPVATEQDLRLRAQNAPMVGAPPRPQFAVDGYLQRTMQRESGGNARAKNPNSSATGLFQFTRPTWNGMIRNYPQLGLTPDGIYDPDQQMRAMRAFTNANRMVLERSGITPTDQNLYTAHFLGPAGAVKFLTNMVKNPMAPAASFVGDGVAEANRSIFFHKDGRPKAAYEVYGNLGSKHGGWTPDFGQGQQSHTNAPQTAFGAPSMGYGAMPQVPQQQWQQQPLPPLPTTVIPSEKPIVDPQQMQPQTLQMAQASPQAPYVWADDRGTENAWSPRVAASGRGFF